MEKSKKNQKSFPSYHNMIVQYVILFVWNKGRLPGHNLRNCSRRLGLWKLQNQQICATVSHGNNTL